MENYGDFISNTVDKMMMHVEETQDAFIFQTLSNFVHNSYGITVEKEELVQAIQLIRMMKEYGLDIHKYYDTATQQTELYRRGYERGLQDGIKKASYNLWVF